MVKFPEEYWLYNIPTNLDKREIEEELKEKVIPRIREIRKILSVLKDRDEIYSLKCELDELLCEKRILKNYPKYLRALQTYMKAVTVKNEADLLKEEKRICYSICDNWYPSEKKCAMGHPGGCEYRPEGKKSVCEQKQKEIDKMLSYVDESKRLYEEAMNMLKKLKINRILPSL
jgi:DNA-binding transcriptional regulator GbsR (MarR family)